MNPTDIFSFFEEQKAKGVDLVLATVCETKGSTYSKIGSYMLISNEGLFYGLLSGGCLEGDLAERAKEVLKNNQSQQVTYDLSQNDDLLWGLGVGCDGLMRIFLQPLLSKNNYEPFVSIKDNMHANQPGVFVTVIESSDHKNISASAVGTDHSFHNFNIQSSLIPTIKKEILNVIQCKESSLQDIEVDGQVSTVLYTILKPLPKILILGAGLDAEPIVRMSVELGWRITVQDHRPAYIEKGNFGAAANVHCIPVKSLSKEINLEEFDAAIVMSHHIEADRDYLKILASTNIPYIGLLGPKERKNKILGELGEAASSLKDRLYGPAGLDIGGRGPSTIALSIVSQIHQELISRKVL